MKNTNLKKLLALALAAVMSASLLTACGNKTEETKTSEAQQSSEAQSSEAQSSEAAVSSEVVAEDAFEHDPVLNELGVEPYVKEEVTITIGLKQNANISDYNTNYYTTMMEEVTGVNIEFLLFPAGNDGNEKLQMMVAGGEKLPDIILWGQNEAVAQQWGAEGYIVPLEDYFANSSIYAAEGYARVKETSGLDIIDYQTCADGHIWQFPSYFESTTNPTYDRVWVYGPWLETLNLELPKTTDEFKAMLQAFKTQDPNGNGKADEIPFVGSSPVDEGWGSTFWEYCMNAFTHSTRNKNFFVSTDGQLSLSYMQEGWKEGIKYIAELVAEGLIDPVSYTQDTETFKQIFNTSGDQIIGCLPYVSPSFINNDHPSKQEWVLMVPLTGPDGFCSTGYSADLPANQAVITADCEHPEVAFRVLDTMCREDFTISNRWGKQGENWDYVEDIKDDAEFKDKDFSATWCGYPAYFYEYNSIWNQPQNNHWQNAGPCFRTAEVAAGWYAANLDTKAENNQNMANYELSLKLADWEAARPQELISKFKFATPDIQAEFDLKKEELKEYVYEKLAMWTTGKADVEAEWDAYLKELDAMGVQDYIATAQAGWNN